MSLTHKYPEAFKRGAEDARAHYERFYNGCIAERDFPPHPYQEPDDSLPWSQRCETEWHAYNAGWYAGLPDNNEDKMRRVTSDINVPDNYTRGECYER